MKAKLIFVLIALFIPAFVFSQELNRDKTDDLLDRIKQVQQDSPDAERQVQQILSESGFDMISPAELTRLSRLLQQDGPEDMLHQFLELMSLRDRHDRKHLENLSRTSLPITTVADQPLTAAQQAAISQFLEDFRVNDDSGSSSQGYPAIAVDNNGNFVVVWEDRRNGNYDIYAQRYNSIGVAQGANFRVNDDSGSSYNKGCPAIAVDGSGNFVVVWQDSRNGQPYIYAQRYSSSGVAQGGNFRVIDDSGSRTQWSPAIAADGSGSFVVVWQDYRNGNADIYAQRYSSSGVKQGVNFRVNDDSGINWQGQSAVAVDRSGNFLVVWRDERNWNIDIYAQRYNSSGVKQSTNFRLNDDSSSDRYYPDIAADGSGSFVVVWQDYRNGNADIYAQRYTSSGVKQGVNFLLNDDSGSSGQGSPAIAEDGSGTFVVVWEDERNGNWDVYAQLFDSQGQRIGSNYRVNNDTGTKEQAFPDVKFVNGYIYYTWQDDRIEGNGWDIFARVDQFTAANPDPPTNVSATDGSYTDRVRVTWSSSNNATHYRVYRNTSSSSSGATAQGSWQTGTTYDDYDTTQRPV